MYPAPPLISCIVATRNAAYSLQRLLNSLAIQHFRDFELVVQDGLSTDATLDILAAHAAPLPAVSVKSEADTGIYDAWNKAVPRAQGQWILFMGADDVLTHAAALAEVAVTLRAQDENTVYVAAPVIMVRPTGSPHDSASIGNSDDSASIVYPTSRAGRDLAQGMAFPHQGLFHRARLFQSHAFDTAFRIAGDYEFVARTFGEGQIALHPQPVVCMALGGLSSRIDSLWRVEWEQWRVARRHFPRTFPWKIGLRMVRSLVCLGIAKVWGLPRAEAFADSLRLLRGKKALWTAPSASPERKP